MKKVSHRLVLAIFTLIGGVSASSAAACEIADQVDQMQLGEVSQFGDLKIRMAQINEGSKSGVLDIKSPDFVLSGLRMASMSSYKFTSCGKEITITFDWSGNWTYPVIRVSTF